MREKLYKQIERLLGLKKAALYESEKRRADALQLNPKFHQEIQKLRKAFDIPEPRRREEYIGIVQNRGCCEFFERKRFGVGSLSLPFRGYSSIKQRIRFENYTEALDEMCYGYGLPSPWINYVKVCLWFGHPIDEDIPIGLEMKFDHRHRLARCYVELYGNESSEDIDYAVKELRLLRQIYQGGRAKTKALTTRKTLNTQRRQRIMSLMKLYPKKTILQLYHTYHELYRDDDMSEDAFRKTKQRMKK